MKEFKKRIMFVLANKIAVRGIIDTPVIHNLGALKEVEIILLTPYQEDEERISVFAYKNIRWMNINQKQKTNNAFIKKLLINAYRQFFSDKIDFGNLVFRFNQINKFQAHLQRVHLDEKRIQRECLTGNYVDRKLGFPFPDSYIIYNILRWVYFSEYQFIDPQIETLLKLHKPDSIVFFNMQKPFVKHFLISAKKHKVKTVGIVGSWDKLTTKGPIPRNLDHYISHNRQMNRELMKYHHIPEHKITLVGWPQMDIYLDQKILSSREDFFKHYNIPLEHRLILFAGYSQRLGKHEPSIVKYISDKIKNNNYRCDCSLLIRPHPKDKNYLKRFGNNVEEPYVVMDPPQWDKLDSLTNILYHSDILISSQGSISLDAIAMNKHIININFDGDVQCDFYESISRLYELDHYKEVAQSDCVDLVNSFNELDQSIDRFLDNPNIVKKDRDKIIAHNIEPFDGQASKRLVDVLVNELE